MKALGVLLVLVLLCAMPAARAQETLDDLTLRQRILEAQGKPPDHYREHLHVVTTSDTWEEHEFHRGLDYRKTYDIGPFHEEEGRLQGRSWDQNANGITTIHEAPLGRERPDVEKVSVTRVHQPEAWRYARLNVRGFGTVEYVDPNSFRVVRTETLTANGRIERDYSDFRTVDGYTIPYHWKTNNQANRIQIEATVESFDTGEVTDKDLAIPPGKDFVQFPAGVTKVDLPATFQMPHVIVRVMIGSRGLDFILDSGASGIDMDANVARQLGLHSYAQISGVVAQRVDFADALVPEVRVGDLVMHNVDITTIPLTWNERSDVQVVGLLGYDFIRSVGLTIDYRNKRVTATPPGSFEAPVMTSESDILPLRIGSHVPMISATINGAVADKMMIDTGAASDLMLFDYFNRRYPEALSPSVATSLGMLPYVPQGVGGAVDAKSLRLQRVDIGRYHFRNFDALDVVSISSYAYNIDGVIGPGILQHFTVGLDYAGGKLFLVHDPGQ